MSYSSKIKADLSKIVGEKRCCQRAELSALVRTSGSITLSGFHQLNIVIRTENSSVARHIFALIKKLYGVSAEVTVKKNTGLKKSNTYESTIRDAKEILMDLGIITEQTGLLGINNQVPTEFALSECCKRAYVRGTFMGAGSVSDPEKQYHMEFIAHNAEFAESFTALLSDFDIESKVLERKNNYIVYIKESEKIIDILNIIGAHKFLLNFENVRIIKEMKNNVNRIVNCETANINKTLDASYAQVTNIRKIQEAIGLSGLDDSLKEIASLRIENPELSLKELGELLDPPLSKSGVNHRLKKLEKIAEKL